MTQRVCLVTGASRGIGRAVALRMARAGYCVVAGARGQAELIQLRTEILAAGGVCEVLAGDVSQPAGVRALVDVALRQFRRVDVVVNNAGIAPLGPVEKLSTEEFDRTMALNCAAVFHMTRSVWIMMRHQREGVIVSISSVASEDPFPGFAVYGATKAWVNIFTKAIADEGRPHNIRAFAIAPGAVDTPLLRSTFPDFPLDQMLAPDVVAEAVEQVCRPEMASRSGETIFVRK